MAMSEPQVTIHVILTKAFSMIGVLMSWNCYNPIHDQGKMCGVNLLCMDGSAYQEIAQKVEAVTSTPHLHAHVGPIQKAHIAAGASVPLVKMY